MPKSIFPRPGYPLVPKFFSEILNDDLSDFEVTVPECCTFQDLRSGVWEHLDPNVQDDIVNLVIRLLNERVRHPNSILIKTLPACHNIKDLMDLELEVRTRNCLQILKQAGKIKSAIDLSTYTVQEMMQAKSFGTRCLLDLVSTLEFISERETEQVEYLYNQDSISDDIMPLLQNEVRKTLELSINSQIRLTDKRIKDIILQIRKIEGNSSLREESFIDFCETLLDLEIVPSNAVNCYNKFRSLRHLIEVSLEQTVESELTQLLECYCPKDSQRHVKLRFGLDGKGGKSLETVAKTVGLTRERIRQKCALFEDNVENYPPNVPKLMSAFAQMNEHSPLRESQMISVLREVNLLTDQFQLSGLFKIAGLLKISHFFDTEFLKEKKIVIKTEDTTLLKMLAIESRRISNNRGAISVQELQAFLKSTELFRKTDLPHIQKVLDCVDEGSWLDKQKHWFWIASSRNRLVNQIRKILSIAPKLSVPEILPGIVRHHRIKSAANIPEEIVESICSQLPDVKMESDKVVFSLSIDPSIELSPTEYIFFELFKKYGSPLKRKFLEDCCFEKGIKKPNFYLTLGYSPILVTVEQGVYGLRGASKIFPAEELLTLSTEREESNYYSFDDKTLAAFFDEEAEGEEEFTQLETVENEESRLTWQTRNETLKTPTTFNGLEVGLFQELGEEENRLRADILKQTRQRLGQSAFRNKVLDAYDFCCCITDTKFEPVLEAAHIIPYATSFNMHVSNGLLLRSDIHVLFDKGLISINPNDFSISISESLKVSEYESLATKTCRLPKRNEYLPLREFLTRHYSWHCYLELEGRKGN